MKYIIARLFAILGTAALFQWAGTRNFYIYLGLSHNLLALYYAKNILVSYTNAENRVFSWLAIAVLILISTLMAITDLPPMAYYFGLHIVLSDVYLLKIPQNDSLDHSKFLYLIRIFVNGFGYLYLTKLGFGLWAAEINLIACGLGWICLLGVLFFGQPKIAKSDIYVIIGYESLILLAIVLLPKGTITFPMILCYHFMLWLIWPVIQVKNRSLKFTLEYSLLTMSSTALIFWIVKDSLQGQLLLNIFAYYHNTFSFITSKNNPKWLLNALKVPGSWYPRI